LREAQRYLQKGFTAEETLQRANAVGPFSGLMLTNLVTMLDGIGLHNALGIKSTALLFDTPRPRRPLLSHRLPTVHSRYFWGLRLHLLTTLHGLPAGFALTGAKADERQVLLDILADPALTAGRDGQIIIADKHYYGRGFEATLAEGGIRLLRPARQGEPARPGTRSFKPLRQIIESANDTFKGQLDLERHGGHTPAGVLVRVLQRILALTTAIWHNDRTG
jgi:Transposase DDE domain